MARCNLFHAAGLGLLIGAAAIGLMFGSDIHRYRMMAAAVEELESCRTDAECEIAWAMVQAAKGGR